MSRRSKMSCVASPGDYISKLPEGIIGDILSRLPIKDAVRTSVLSKEWEYHWISIHNIDISDRENRLTRQRGKKTIFVNFVERLLFFTQNVKSFRLSCMESYDSTRLKAWMSAVLRRNVENFELHLRHQDDFVMPHTLRNNTHLRKLKLKWWCTRQDASVCTFRVALNNYFPNLRELYLDSVKIMKELSVEEPLVFDFPVMDTLDLRDCTWSNVNLMEIISPALSSFNYETSCRSRRLNDYTIKICGAKLLAFNLSGSRFDNIILEKSTVVYANLAINSSWSDDVGMVRKCGLQVRNLLKGFTSLSTLRITRFIVETIAQSREGLPLPRYDKLERLYLDSCCGKSGVLLELLHAAPFLKFLELEREWGDYDYGEMESVPSCVVSHLEVVTFGFWDKHRTHIVKFVLKHGVNLERVCFHFTCGKTAEEIIEQLSAFPRASKSVTIAFGRFGKERIFQI